MDCKHTYTIMPTFFKVIVHMGQALNRIPRIRG